MTALALIEKKLFVSEDEMNRILELNGLPIAPASLAQGTERVSHFAAKIYDSLCGNYQPLFDAQSENDFPKYKEEIIKLEQSVFNNFKY